MAITLDTYLGIQQKHVSPVIYDLDSYMLLQEPHDWKTYRLFLESVVAAGTSEGVKKAWDTRGRGRKPIVRTAAQLRKEAVQIKSKWDDMGHLITHVHGKLDDIHKVESTSGRLAHLLKVTAEWGIAFLGFHDLYEYGHHLVEQVGTNVDPNVVHVAGLVALAGSLHKALNYTAAHHPGFLLYAMKWLYQQGATIASTLDYVSKTLNLSI